MLQPASHDMPGMAARATLPRGDLRWYFNRLRCMPLREIPFRLLRAAATRAESMGLRSHAAPAPDLERAAPPWLRAPAGEDAAAYLRAADRIIAGEFDVFALRDVQLGMPPRWNRDPRTGTEAPLTFGKLLDYRDPTLVGDIKYLWEPNRHLELVALAQAHALSNEARYGQALLGLLDSWIEACPCPRGPNWSSALEPAIRLINWSCAWQLIGGARSALFADAAGGAARARWLASVYQHARFVRGFLSRHSSANNHLIGEASGLFVAAVTWPHWPRSARWLAAARRILIREALLQNAPDGVNREQAVCYQQFEFDLLLVAWLAARNSGADFPAGFAARLESMLEYLASILDVGGNVPMFGDADDGRVVALSQEARFCPYRSLLATGAVLFERGDFAAKAGHLDAKTRWLLGPDSAARFARAAAAPAKLPVKRAFPDGGYYILGCDFETAREIRLVADAGPLGYGTLAAHGHADALSFTLSVGGCEMFIDPGTCTYRADSPWRRYFRGTSAHNTLRVDGLDQSEPGGSFMWLTKAAAGCTQWHSAARADSFDGWHDGYARLPDPVIHRRRIVLDKAQRRILVEDRLEMAGTHHVELFFHCAEHCRVLAGDDCWLLDVGGRRARLHPPALPGSRVRVARGAVDPPLGWTSRRFDSRAPSPTLVWHADLTGPALLRTRIDC
ncbi:MAG TPA: alginate lyase family protein [Steroidobacteraceae bacterium]|nr:alginate lyase family protein [Steroidobacteraceae bacterium]